MNILEIRKKLKKSEDKSFKKFQNIYMLSNDKYYRVRTTVLNEIVEKIKEYDFILIEKLWASGYFEEKILGCKILAKISDKNSKKTLKFIEKLSGRISDWAVCDTLGSQSIKKINISNQKEIYNLAEKLIASKNLWKRRLGIVFLIELNKKGFDSAKIKELAQKLKNDNEYYVKKAMLWLKNELNKN